MGVCSRCLMDSSDVEIVFNELGQCNHCTASIARWNSPEFQDQEKRDAQLKQWVDRIKKDGQGKEYDCIIGLSGGVDSSYVAYLVKKVYGLRPLAVHLDNGWNSELAVRNIDKILDRLEIDLVTDVLDWEEFSALQRSFLRASVLDMELLTDHAIGVALWKISQRFQIPYFISGFNFQSENVMPPTWIYPYKMDSLNIQDIYKKYGEGKKLKSFEFLSFREFLFFGKNKMTLFPILNFVDYHKESAIQVITKELGWRNYGNKHDESVFTKFYQDILLFEKLGIDKRKAHYSSLICTGQISREEAFQKIQMQPLSEEARKKSIQYVLKKLNLTEPEFEQILQAQPKKHWEFASYAKRKQQVGNVLRKLKLR
jgi:N-acetyl sugar amidotransferase